MPLDVESINYYEVLFQHYILLFPCSMFYYWLGNLTYIYILHTKFKKTPEDTFTPLGIQLCILYIVLLARLFK